MAQRGTPILRAMAGPLAGQEFELKSSSLTLGRAKTNDLVVADPELAELQAKISFRGRQWSMVNLTAESKLFVREIPVDRCELKPGVPIRIGSTMFELKYRDEASPAEPKKQESQHSLIRTSAKPEAKTGTDFFVSPEKTEPEQTSPVREQTSPVREQTSPVREQTSPGREQTSPGREQTSPAEEQTSPQSERGLFAPGQANQGIQVPMRIPEEASESSLPSGLEEQSSDDGLPQLPFAGMVSPANLAYTVIVVLLVIGGAVLLHVIGRRPEPTPFQHVMIQEGGDGTIVSIQPYRYDRIGDGNGEGRWRQLVDVKKVDPPRMVELLGKAQGTAEVSLFHRGRHVLTLRISVRGKVWQEPVFQAEEGLEEIVARAQKLLERGQQLERDHLYEAIEDCFRPTADFMEKLEDSPAREIASEAKRLLVQAENRLEARLRDYEKQFWKAYYLKDYARALRQLERILEWVPSGSDRRHQRAAIMEDILRRKAGLSSAQQ